MKRKELVILAALLIPFKAIRGQVTQFELTAGFYKSDFSLLTINSLGNKNKFSILTSSFFQKFYREEEFVFDETGVQTFFYRNLTKNLSVGPALYYNSVAGFAEKLSFLVSTDRNGLAFLAIPAISHTEKDGGINGGLFVQLEYAKHAKLGWNFWANIQILSEWKTFSIHSRSFQQLRIGVACNNSQFGAAADLDVYGHAKIWKQSIGIFARRTFLGK